MTLQADDDTSDIGNAPIDPTAEPAGAPAPLGRGQQESQFFAEYKLTHELNMVKLDHGWIGKAIGSSSQAPTNIAAILLAVLMVFIAISAFMPPSPALDETRKWSTGLVTLVVGYLFGAGSRGK